MQKQKKLKNKHGSALLLTTILLFVILGMVVSLTYVTVMEQKMSSKTKSSVGSFYSAESGIEWALNKIATTSVANPVIADAFPSFSGGKTACPASFNCEVWLLDQNGNVITDSATDLSEVRAVRSVGTNRNETQRAIEAAVAAGSDSYALLEDIKSDGTDGGTFTAGSWHTRDLNTEVVDEDNIVSLSGDQFTLQAGTYRIHAKAPAYTVNSHRARLQNMSDSNTILWGTNEFTITSGVANSSFVFGQFTITSAKTFELQHYCLSGQTPNGYGTQDGISGTSELYSVVEIWKIKR